MTSRLFLLALVTFVFSAFAESSRSTVFYYSKKADGSLKFTDEPPEIEAPSRYRKYTRPKIAKRTSHKSQPVAMRESATEPQPYRHAVVYVPQSEILVTFNSSYISKAKHKYQTYLDMIKEVASEHRIEPALIAAIIQTESNYNPQAVSNRGARGLMQLMPKTAEGLGVNNLHDPEQNIRAGTKHIKRLMKRYQGDLNLVLAAYNAGDVAVAKYRGVPPYRETIDYIARVRKYYRQFENL